MRLAGIEDAAELLEKQLALDMSKMTLEEALTLARAFSHYLNLMGIAETHHRLFLLLFLFISYHACLMVYLFYISMYVDNLESVSTSLAMLCPFSVF